MKAFPLAWHKECLKNSEAGLAREEISLQAHEKRTVVDRLRTAFLRQQIEEAEKQGKLAFCPDKFLKNMRPPGV
jgi:hypothetical protein